MDENEDLILSILDEKDVSVTYKASKKKKNNTKTIWIIVGSVIGGTLLLGFGVVVAIGFIIGGSAFALFTGIRKAKKESHMIYNRYYYEELGGEYQDMRGGKTTDSTEITLKKGWNRIVGRTTHTTWQWVISVSFNGNGLKYR